MNQIQKDIKQLVDASVINLETANAIENYYQQKESEKSSSSLTNILILLGAILVSLGIILLIAHNWDNLGNTVKTVFAFIPLVIGQGLCVFALLKRSNNNAWREVSATITLFAVASCIALISQVYHVDGTLPGFLITWICLTIPVAFIMRSSVTALLLIAISSWYAIDVGLNFFGESKEPYWYLLFMPLLFIYYIIFIVKDTISNFFTWFNWFFVISFSVCISCFIGKINLPSQWIALSYFALYCLWFLIGRTREMRERKNYANPYNVIGTLGIIVMLALSSFKFWWTLSHNSNSGTPIFSSVFTYITLLIICCVLALLIIKLKDKLTHPFVISFMLYFILTIFVGTMESMAALLINLMLLFIGIFYVDKGNKENHFGILNFGLLIIALLTVLRFFDDGIPFVWRGIFFVATGIGFFAANYKLSQKRKTIQSTPKNFIDENI